MADLPVRAGGRPQEWDGRRVFTPNDFADQAVSDYCRANLDSDHPAFPVSVRDGNSTKYYVSPYAWEDLTREMIEEIRELESKVIPELTARSSAADAEREELANKCFDVYIPS
jgi:hypothetical protein